MSQKKRKQIKKYIQVEKVAPVELLGKDWGVKSVLKKYWKFLVGICLLAVVVYFNGQWANFVSDDYASITINPVINSFKGQWVGGNTATMVTYLVNKFFGNAMSWPYHMANLVFYIPFLVVAFVVLMLMYDNFLLAAITMLLFAIHPIHVEAVTWISGRIYIIISLYIMLAFLCFIYFVKKNNWKYLIGTIGFFMLGFMTDKPRPFALFLIIAIYVLSEGLGRIKINVAKLLAIFAALIVITFAVAYPFIKNRIDVVNSGYNTSESIFYNPFFQYPTGVSKYLQLLWFPVDLTLYHTMFVFPVWLNWAIILTYLLAIVYFFFKNKPYFFALSFIMAATLPSIMPIKVSWLVAERYMFLGSLGYCLFLALLIIDLNKRFKLFLPVSLICISTYFGVRIFLRNIDWQTNHNLWVNTCQVSPNSHNAWNNIGDDYDKLKDYGNAVKGFTQSTIVKPNYADAYHNRANIFYKIGRLDLARESYGVALNFSPNLYQTYISLCQIDLTEKRYDLAMAHVEAALKIDPMNPQAAYIAAVTYAQMGQLDKAQNILEQIVKVNPQFTMATEALKQIKLMPRK